MSTRQEGTRLWCPHCKQYQSCKGVSPAAAALDKEQRWSSRDFDDIHWFRRGRLCQACNQEFLTAELDERLVYELMEWRSRAAAGNVHLRKAYEEIGNLLKQPPVGAGNYCESIEPAAGFKITEVTYQKERSSQT